MTDWNSHFRAISKRTIPQAEFGTVMGQYTVAELKDLLAAKDVSLSALATQVSQFFQNWQMSNPAAANAWHSDYATLLSNYAAAKSKANVIIGANSFSILPADMTPADDTYKAVLTALNPSWQQNTSAKGSLSDLIDRITSAGAAALHPSIPQPGQNDFDVHQMGNLNAVASAIPQPVKTLVGTIAPSVVPQDKTGGDYKPFDVEQFAKDHWKGLAIGGFGLIASLKILAKFGL